MIARTLARHDALAALEVLQVAPGLLWFARLGSRRNVDGRPGQKLARALTELGPSFIKFGQFLSTRADLLGEQVAADLSELQDRLPPFDSQAARATIERELGRPIDALFSHFEDEPVSAASIAQVHLAVVKGDERPVEEPSVLGAAAAGAAPTSAAPLGALGDQTEDWSGREVAVKVLRPGVEQAFARDLELFYTVADFVERTQPRLRRLKPREVVGVFEETVKLEMDLRMEAAAASELHANFAQDPDYHVPDVDWERTSRRVLTVERVGGIPLDDKGALVAAGHNLTEVLTKAAGIFFKQVFRDGLFHGDQHPGNMWVDADGKIVAVDFGIMGRLDRRTRYFLADMLLATLARDYRRLAEVHIEAGYLPHDHPPEIFAQALRSVCEPIFGRPLNQISFARLLAQLLQLTESFDMPVQPQLLLLQKNMLMAEGISRSLDPSLNIWVLAQPLIEGWVRENRGPEARLKDAAQDLSESLQRLPRLISDVERASSQIAHGGLRLDPQSARSLGAGRRDWGSRIALAIAATALVAAIIALI
ncbi:MAG: AarF/UbiB family protein [Kiloniellales bacterium]|nr:AarF/UbiB family protein [Kiloniellales bacterium]